jgi:hypothetical protein
MQPFRPTGDYEQQPHAAVCKGGHVASWFVYTYEAAPYCVTCGEPLITQCPNPDCAKPLPAAENIGDWVPYHNNCPNCGKAFPWHAAAIERAERIVRMQSEIHQLDDATAKELARFAQDVAQHKATPAEVSTFGQWFRIKAGIESARAVGAALKDIATSVISEVIVKVMMP